MKITSNAIRSRGTAWTNIATKVFCDKIAANDRNITAVLKQWPDITIRRHPFPQRRTILELEVNGRGDDRGPLNIVMTEAVNDYRRRRATWCLATQHESVNRENDEEKHDEDDDHSLHRPKGAGRITLTRCIHSET